MELNFRSWEGCPVVVWSRLNRIRGKNDSTLSSSTVGVALESLKNQALQC